MACDETKETVITQDLTKLILNNKIVELRKDVRKSRVYTINKLCKEIRKLKSKTGTEEQKTKNLNKAERFVRQIMLIKKMKDDDITKFALRNERSLVDITNDVHETLETKALARLVNHKCIAEKIEAFRIAYPRWKHVLEYLLSTLGEKYKDKKSKKTKASSVGSKLKKKSDDIKKMKTVGSDLKKISDDKKKVRTNQDSRKSFTNNSGIWFVEEIKNDQPNLESNQRTNDEFKGRSSYKNENLVNTDRLYGEDNQNEVTESKTINSHKNKKAAVNINNAKARDDSLAPTRINYKESLNEEKNIPADGNTTKAAADPFFVTKDNKSYMSISIKDIKNDSEESQNEDHNERKSFISFKKSTNIDRKPKQEFFRNGRKFTSYDHNKKFTGNPRSSRTFETKPEKSAPLHPSWEAKRKQSFVIQQCQFQGKKIKFED